MTMFSEINDPPYNAADPSARRRTGQGRSALTLLLTSVLAVASLLTTAGSTAASEAPGGNARQPAETASVRCDPSTLNAWVGTTVSVTIYVQNVVDLYGLDVRLVFDPAYAQVIDSDPVAAGVQIQPLGGFLSPDFVVRRTADNATGQVRYAATQISPSPPVSGSGAVARIDLRGIQPGATTVPITQVELARNDGTSIPATTQACTWNFSQPRPLFLPLVTIR